MWNCISRKYYLICKLRYVFMRTNPIDMHSQSYTVTHTLNTFVIEFSIVTVSKHLNASNCGQDEDDLFTENCSTNLTLIFKTYIQCQHTEAIATEKKKKTTICALNCIFLFRFSMYAVDMHKCSVERFTLDAWLVAFFTASEIRFDSRSGSVRWISIMLPLLKWF